MTRGTTATIQFTLPFDVTNISGGTITILQEKSDSPLTIKKDLTDCTCADDKIILKLTQSETLEMVDNIALQIQLKIKTLTDDVIASRIYRVSVNDILDEVLL